jgi:peptide subunit release factor 1 (eRF1)
VLDRVIRAEGIDQVVIGGDDVFVSLVRSEFPQHLLEKVLDIIPLDIGAPERTVLASTLEALRQKDAETDAQVVDRLFEAVRGSDLGVLGAEDTLAALQLGQVDELVITARPDILTNVDHLATTGPDIAPTPTGNVTDGLAAVEAAAAVADEAASPAEPVPAPEKVANQLVTLARQTSAYVRFIEEPALLAEVGGVGAFLRFKI